MPRKTAGLLSKTARLIILMRAEDEGRIQNRSEAARLFNPPPSTMTLWRDFRDLAKLRVLLAQMETYHAN